MSLKELMRLEIADIESALGRLAKFVEQLENDNDGYQWFTGDPPLSFPVCVDRGNGYPYIVRDADDYPKDTKRYCYPPKNWKDTTSLPALINSFNPVWIITDDGKLYVAGTKDAVQRTNVTGWRDLP